MSTANRPHAKTLTSMPVEALVPGQDTEIPRDDPSLAGPSPLSRPAAGKRIGIARGKNVIPANIDEDSGLITELFVGNAR